MLSLSLDGFAASSAKVNDSTPCIGSNTGSRPVVIIEGYNTKLRRVKVKLLVAVL